MDKHNTWNMGDYLKKRGRSEQEEKMHKLLQKVSEGKLTIEDMQLFFDKTIRPLDFFRRYDGELHFSNDKEAKRFMNLLMEIWNQTPRTELHGKTPSQTYENGEKRCELCVTTPKCPHCEIIFTERETKTYGEGEEVTELFCEKCNNTFHDFKMDISPKLAEDTATIFKKIATNITDSAFDRVWGEAKKEIKDFSKRELAEEMFFAGVVNSFVSIYALGVPKEMLKVWAKILDGEDQGMEEAMEELEKKMKVSKSG